MPSNPEEHGDGTISVYEQIQRLIKEGQKLPESYGAPSPATQEIMKLGPAGDRGNDVMEGGKPVHTERP